MTSFKACSAIALLASTVASFPHMKVDYSPFEANPHDKRQLLGIGSPQGTGALPLVPPPFDAKSQRVETTGEHEYRDPGPNDQRGQCPGLNALANQ